MIVSIAAAVCSFVVSALTATLIHDHEVSNIRDEQARSVRRSGFVLSKGFKPPRPLGLEAYPQQIVDDSGKVVTATPGELNRGPITQWRPSGIDEMAEIEICDSPEYPGECLLVTALSVRQPDGRGLTLYSYAKAPPPWVSDRFALLAGLISLGLVATVGLLTWLGVRRTLLPVEAIRREMAEITSHDLARRVPEQPRDDEISNLARTVNATLNRLEELVTQQRRLASDASHDLRSPLTGMRTELEMGLISSEETDWPDTARRVLAGIERLQEIVGDLLLLAKMDSGRRGDLKPLDLSALARSEIDRVQRRFPPQAALEPGVRVMGDRLRLARLLSNLLDNAERHARSAVWVLLRADPDLRQVFMEVRDDGGGIPEDKREEVFRRFTRLDSSRSRDAGGSGLGLAIAREIAETHGGTLVAADTEVGARLLLCLPLLSVEDPGTSDFSDTGPESGGPDPSAPSGTAMAARLGQPSGTGQPSTTPGPDAQRALALPQFVGYFSDGSSGMRIHMAT
ncbi:HAMP domain-containing sensor histidine kinase [Spongiactinospora sp. TRM90649]|uniref:sensor histidine kinase n=1 Tax=Spongiactinospora sp. TRM90649 TaxID=3031114 RepID=UPI0023F756E1|nr:HAMP domain-containing sensor histidine kinase [Spongiactinospora sp. TRM90649]MDF5754408.1 HAMP domain-containing sensor histidine kinase [Spongiactinospora sp. TRM90649]